MRVRLLKVGLCIFLFIVALQMSILNKWRTSTSIVDYQLNEIQKAKTKEIQNIEKNDPNQPITFDPNTWIINNKVAQYSSKIILFKEDLLIIEALAFIDDSQQSSKQLKSSEYAFLIKIRDIIHEIPISEVILMSTSIHKKNSGRRFFLRVR